MMVRECHISREDLEAVVRDATALERVERYVRFARAKYPDFLAGLQIGAEVDGRIAVTVLGPDDCFQAPSLAEAFDQCLHALEND